MLEEIKEMSNQGISDKEIAKRLLEAGHSPREVEEALAQSKIKAAVNTDNSDAMQASMMSQSSEIPAEQEPEQYSIPLPQGEQQYENYQPEQYGSAYPQPELSSETISEIASQLIDEKLSKINKKTSEFDEFKVMANSKVENLNDRLARIEKIISELNSAIIQRTGSYLEDIKNIHSEVSLMQDSMSKLVPSVVDSLKKISAGKS